MKLGLVGYPLGHSFSAQYFGEKFAGTDNSYLNYEVLPEQLRSFIQTQKLDGFNITIPYKIDIIPLLDRLTESAEQVGAVNTVTKTTKGLLGTNTDVIGFRQTIEPLPYQDKKALILGTGGASRAVQYVCDSLQIPYTLVSRSPTENRLSYDQIDDHCIVEHQIIIHTTPLGMYPDVHTAPKIDYDALTAQHICIDLVYNPAETLFIKKSKAQNAQTLNGQTMLISQAEASYDFWISTDL